MSKIEQAQPGHVVDTSRGRRRRPIMTRRRYKQNPLINVRRSNRSTTTAKIILINRWYQQNRLSLVWLVVMGLIITFAATFYMHNKILSAENEESDEVKACVRRMDDQCQLYPCTERSGAVEEVAPPNPFFGYAGNFVHRDRDMTKPLPKTLGDTGWASGCILSDEYKFVFIHVLKSGGTAVKKFIKDALCGPADSECEYAPPTLVRAEGCIKSIRDHQDYFHFSFVRSPFSRLFSAYSMMDGFPPLNGIHGRLPTKDFSFADFVLKPQERELHSSIWPGHYDTQESFLFSDDWCPMFDFVGRVEHFDEDMSRVLTHLNATKMLKHLDSIGGQIIPANSWGADKKKSIGGGLRKEYSMPQVVDRVASDYRKDFELLGYNPYAVPQK